MANRAPNTIELTMPTSDLMTSVTPSANAEAVVDLAAIGHNVRVLREHAGSSQVMAVVKADGYGHGATQVARAALAAGAAEIGVATLEEALALRRDGITAPVLAWLHPPGTDFAPALQSDIQLALSSSRQLHDLLAAAKLTGVTANITVKVDTGLSRNGVSAAEYPAMLTALRRAAADEAVRLRGIMSHLVYGDDPDNPVNDLQSQRLRDMRNQARHQGVHFEIAHLSNSPAAMTRPDLGYDMVRDMEPLPDKNPDTYGRRCVLRAHVDRRPRHHAGAAADRLRRRRLPHAERTDERAHQRPAEAERRPDLHGPVRRRPRPRRGRCRRG